MNDSLPMLRRHRLRLIGVVAALVVGGLLFWALRDRGPDPRIEAIRKKGYPTSFAELDAWYPHVPESTNRALAYTQVFASPLFTNQPNDIETIIGGSNWLPPRGQTLAPEDKADLTALLSTNEAILRPFYTCSGPSRYPIDLKQGFEVLLPHLTRCKTAVNLLTAAAILHAGNGQTEQALLDLEAAGRVADSLSQEPLLISQLVRMACWGMVVPRVERVISVTSMNDAQLARLQTLVTQAEEPRCFTRGLAGEQAAGLSAFQDPVRTFSYGMHNGADVKLSERLRVQLLVAGLRASGFFAKDRAFLLAAMATNVANTQLPFPEKVKAGQSSGSALPPHRFYMFSNMLLPALGKTFLRDADYCARLRVAQTALAIQRFRLAHTNALPATLDELVPAYLACAPVDPHTGKLLRYKLKHPGYVVYSLGQNGTDEGGLDLNSKNPTAALDLPFTVEK